MSNSLKKSIKIFASILLLLGGNLLFAQSDKQQQLEQQRRDLLNQIAQINKLRQSNKKQEINILNQVEDLDQKIKVRENLIRVTNRQANLLTREINTNINKISTLRDELQQLKEDYAQMIRKSYKSKSSQSRIMFLLSSENFLQAYKRVKYMKQYSNYRHKQGEQIKDRTALLQETNQKLVEQKKEKEQLIVQNTEEQAKLREEKKQQDGLIATIRKKESSYATQIRDKQRAADRIDKEIDRIIREAIAASNKETSTTKTTGGSTTTFALTPEAKALANDFVSNKGKLPWPVETGRVYKKFGTSRHPTLPNITTYNSGVEIETQPGSMARAAFKGTVFKIQGLPGANKAVYVRHGNYITVYQNLKNLKVHVNQQVTEKQELGEIAENSFNGKTILKFLVYKDSDRQNPADWVYNM
ncbi:murein hydrolase activator EnvC family protein [Leeuwenhoekiella sp. A16]|uniref:murein hydrolase activator EnvC family protein n=1 Tax=unclassified Leeuwenhoekiella TaxID=2615029 RepID=UPI003A811C99